MKPLCCICNIEMNFVEKFKTKKAYFGRRWKCPVCGNMQTTFGYTENDELHIPNQGVKQINRMYKKEEDNRL